jgi:hypothetical protein
MKKSLLILVSSLLASSLFAQPASLLVIQGRENLRESRYTLAKSDFERAVVLDSRNETAKFFLSITRLIALPELPGVRGLLDQLGVDPTGRDFFAWTADVPRDNRRVPIPPNGMTSGQALKTLEDTVLPEIQLSIEALNGIRDPNFVLFLAENETRYRPVILDLGDVVMIRSILHAMTLAIHFVNDHNLDVRLNQIYGMSLGDGLNVQSILSSYPDLLDSTSPAGFVSASKAFLDSARNYHEASDFIRARAEGTERLFNLEEGMVQAEDEFRSALTEVERSLDGEVQMSFLDDDGKPVFLNLSNYFGNSFDARSLLPDFVEDSVVAGSLPDPSFNGILRGYSVGDFEAKFANHLIGEPPPPSVDTELKITGIAAGPGDTLILSLGGASNNTFVVEVSVDLRNWIPLTGPINGASGAISFFDPASSLIGHRFYRVR